MSTISSCIPESRRPRYFDAGPFLLAGTGQLEPGFAVAFTQEVLQDVINYSPKDDDLFIVTYPKCGTTWMQQIVCCMKNGFPPKNAHELFSLSPFLEMMGTGVLKPTDGSSTEYTSIKIHLPYELTPKNSKAKYIVVLRNPKDTVVSFFHHTKGINLYGFQHGLFDDYFELFMEGNVDFGEYYDWITSWLPHRKDPNVFWITYERMKSHTKEVLKELADFIGVADKMKSNPNFIQDVMHGSSLTHMRQTINTSMALFLKDSNDNLEKNDASPEESPKKGFEFVRKGVVNDWKNTLSTEQNERISQKFRLKAQEYPELLTVWEDYSWL